MDKKEVGLKICKRRKEMGLTQKELAQRLHVTDKAETLIEGQKGRLCYRGTEFISFTPR